jgi:murein L,D-transpeptidase YcbB/YkuD
VKRIRPLRIAFATAAAATVAIAAACGKGSHQYSSGGEVSHNWKPVSVSSVAGVTEAQVQADIQKQLSAEAPDGVSKDSWKHVNALYKRFGGLPLWLDEHGIYQPRAGALERALADADSDALALARFPINQLGDALLAVHSADHPTAEQLANVDVMLTTIYAMLGEDLMTGQLKPSNFAQSWHINPEEEHVDSALALTLRTDSLPAGLERMRPLDSGYVALRKALMQYRGIVQNGGWNSVPSGRALKRGDTDSPTRIAALRRRLAVEHYPLDSATPANARVYDASLAGAIALFQQHHAIGVDSTLGPETVDALNVPADYRLAEIAANLERYRWLPRNFGSRYILVNVPEFRLTAYDSSQAPLTMKVIVGQEYEDKATPVFSDSMETVVFRPYWNVPPGIAEKEVWPKVNADPGYLAARNMEVVNDHGTRLVRQRPGDHNALGLVKFLFPNDFNIYLHDTPDDQLFDKDVRAFSHGCIRVEKPDELAEWVLGWPADKVHQAMQDGPDAHSVRIPNKIPVYIVYFTAYSDNGDLRFGNDLYNRDDSLVEAVRPAAMPSADVQKALAALRQAAGAE